MVETVISIRTARLGDEADIARGHDAAWRDAYQGVIPGPRARADDRAARARRGGAWRSRGGTRCWCWISRTRSPATPAMGATDAGARLTAARFSSSISRRNTRARASGGACSRRRATISPATAICLSSSGRWRTTIGRSSFYRRSAGGSCAARMRLLAGETARARRFRLRAERAVPAAPCARFRSPREFERDLDRQRTRPTKSMS